MLKVDSKDSTILYVDTESETAATGSIKEATKQDETYYYANILVIYKNTQEDDKTNLIWGAAVDKNNMLQNADDEDVLVPVTLTKD